MRVRRSGAAGTHACGRRAHGLNPCSQWLGPSGMTLAPDCAMKTRAAPGLFHQTSLIHVCRGEHTLECPAGADGAVPDRRVNSRQAHDPLCSK